MSEKKYELILIFSALIIACFFLIYETLDSPKYNRVEAVPISTSEHFTRETATQSSGSVNINTASSDELCTLDGVGEAKAAAIIEYREKNGDFRSAEEIMQVEGISKSIYSKNLERITV